MDVQRATCAGRWPWRWGAYVARGVTVVGAIGGAALSVGCATARPGSQVDLPPHRPEPVAPFMMPAAVVPTPSVRDVLRSIADSVLTSPMWRNARWGMLVVDPVRGDTLLSHDADRLFMPASNQKLLTGAIALQVLGPSYEWRTPVLLSGQTRGHTFTGDVLVYGSGDPSVSHALRGGDASAAFTPVVEALRARGITRIVGRILPAGDAFPGTTTGFGWAWDDFDAGYSAAVDELMYNEGELYVHVRAGARAGQPVVVRTLPTRSHPEVVVRATTRARAATDAPRLAVAYDSTGTRLVVDGTLALGDSVRVTVAYRHPADAYVTALRERLADSGIVVQAPPRAAAARTPGASHTTDTLVVLTSAPFGDVLRRLQKPSQNQIAELLFRTSARVATGSGAADSAQALGARMLALWGITSQDAAYRDGSGLSRHDYLTPRAVVRVLDAMRTSPWDSLYRESLPIAGVDGTIATRMRGTPAQGNVRAKTGTLDKARSLSGYITTADGQPLLFSLLANNFTVPSREVERVQDLIAAYLASVSLRATDAR